MMREDVKITRILREGVKQNIIVVDIFVTF